MDTKPGTRLRTIRELKQLSQAQLAERTGISKGTISLTERNLTSISIDNLGKICSVLQVSADYIIFGDVSERDDDWRRLSATEDGLIVRQVVLDLHKQNRLTEFLGVVSKLKPGQLDIVLQLARSLIAQGQN